jgi:hypothetical protein
MFIPPKIVTLEFKPVLPAPPQLDEPLTLPAVVGAVVTVYVPLLNVVPVT